ncbi:unnamed protein product [Urochloa decumbens]|uniref:FBD domain-containing protein n=1 Tax=Urochloa decumbens TaxID=240449 RepID=A0ABC8ZXP1_9POAL
MATRPRSHAGGGGGQSSTRHHQRTSGGGEDLISLLPDCVLGEIVTRLPTRDGARVQVLSSRWRHAWRSSPLNLDDRFLLRGGASRVLLLCIVSHALALHRGPGRRLRLGDVYLAGNSAAYDYWLRSPALDGLRFLEIQPGQPCLVDPRTLPPLPPPALRFAPTLRVLRIGSCSLPSAAALRFPHLETLSLCGVSVSEDALHGVLAGCPALETLVLDECVGFAQVRIASPTIRTLAVSVAHSLNPMPEVTMRQVVVEDAPRLQHLAPFRHRFSGESFELRVVSAPGLRMLGCVSRTISRLELGDGATTVFKVNSCRIDHVQQGKVVSQETRSEMRAVRLGATLGTVRSLALEDVDRTDVVCNFLRCFPCLEHLYVSAGSCPDPSIQAKQGFRSGGSYDELNPIQCLELHLRKVVLNGYKGEKSDVKFAKLFVRHARVLELMTIRFRTKHFGVLSKEWIEGQQKQLHVKDRASQHAKFQFVHDFGHNYTDLPEAIHDSSRDDPFSSWFEQ